MIAPHGIWSEEPGTCWEDAFLAGNGEQGIMVYGERVVFTHHRYVLPNGTRDLRPPVMADKLAQIRELLLTGHAAQAQREVAQGRKLLWPQPFHPGFELVVSRRRPESGPYRRTTDFTTGEITLEPAGHRAFVSRADGVAVQRMSGDVALRLTGDLPGKPDDVVVTATAYEKDGLVYLNARGVYPRGLGAYAFEALTLMRVTGGTVVVDGDTAVVHGAHEILLLTKLDRHETSAGATEPLEDALLALAGFEYATLLDRHAAIHGPIYRRVALDLGVSETDRDRPVGGLDGLALVERLFHAGRYLLLSASGVLPPRLTGLWIGAWGAAWSGDFTTDANLNLQMAGMNIGAMPELIDGYLALIRGQIDHWRENARSIYGVRGILAPSRTDGEQGRIFHFHDDWPWTMWLAGADWLLYPLVEYQHVTGKTPAELPGWLQECALFWEDFLAGTGGVIVPSFSPENGPGGGPYAAVNATMDIAAARHALRDSATASRLPQYRIDERGALAEWAWDAEHQENHRHISHLYPVWPLHDINPDDTPELAAAARTALELRGDENLSAHGSLHRALAAARLKDGVLAWANVRKLLDNDMFFASLMSSHNPGRDIYNADAALTLPGVLIELLVDSWPGVVELLPALPPHLPRGTVRGLTCRTQVTIQELTWDGNRITAVLQSPIDQTITILHRPSELRASIALAAATPYQLDIPHGVTHATADTEPS